MAETAIVKTTAVKSTKTAAEVRTYVKRMYTRAHEAKAEGRPVAWVMFGVHGPILRAMGITPVFTENYAGLCAAKRYEGVLIEKAESEGYSNQICGYVRTGLGFSALRKEGGKMPEGAPDGGMADPDMMIGCSLACDPRYKWYEATGHYSDTPCFNYDSVLYPNSFIDDQACKEYYIKYEVDQLHRLVAFLEEQTRTKMDWDRLRYTIKLQHDIHKMRYEVYQLRKATPAVMPTQDGLNTMVPHMFMPAEEESLEFYTRLRDEVKERVDNGVGVIEDEKHRILWAGGLPPWHSMYIFNYFESKGAVFPMETAYYPGEPYDEFDVDSDDPIEIEVRRSWERTWETLRRARKLGGNSNVQNALDFMKDYKIDGLVYHGTKSCRATTIGQIHEKNIINSHVKIPALFLESDIVDVRDFSEVQTKMKIDAFLETVEAFKRQGS
ncbi:MAG: 2-hydroxyacyl-CoA dehydratase subunit D [Bacillota bacterium]